MLLGDDYGHWLVPAGAKTQCFQCSFECRRKANAQRAGDETGQRLAICMSSEQLQASGYFEWGIGHDFSSSIAQKTATVSIET